MPTAPVLLCVLGIYQTTKLGVGGGSLSKVYILKGKMEKNKETNESVAG